MSSEMAMCYNILITPIFWIFLSKYIFTSDTMKCAEDATNPQHGFCRYMVFSEAMIHTAPLLCSIFEIVCTKMVFLHSDSWAMFGSGVVYTLFNYIGTKFFIKHPIYPPPLDWSNFWESLVGYLLQAPVLYFLNECIATWT